MQPVSVNNRQPVVSEPAVTHGIRHDLYVGLRLHRLDHLFSQLQASHSFGIETGVGERTPKCRLLLDEQHLCSCFGGAERCR